MGIGLVDLADQKYSKKKFNKIITEDLSTGVLNYLNKMTFSKNGYFARLNTSFKEGVETNTVSIYRAGIIKIPVVSQKVCEIIGSRQFHDAGDIEKIHDDGAVEYKIYSEVKVEAKVIDPRAIPKITLDRIILMDVNYTETLLNADQGNVIRNYASVNTGIRHSKL